MSKRRWAGCVAVALGLMPPTSVAQAESRYTSTTASETSQTVSINAGVLTIINDSDSYAIYVRVFGPGDTTGNATTAHTRIDPDESLGFSQTGGIKAVSLITATGESAAVRLIYW